MVQLPSNPAGAVPAAGPLDADIRSVLPLADIQAKYSQEREKRLRTDTAKQGAKQFVDFYDVDRLKEFSNDPWITENPLPSDDGNQTEILIIGAGYGGLLYAVRLLEAGFKLEDIRIADVANGFGGTWYWNRYPNLKCDMESYIYMPLLEETGYMPTQKYTAGTELKAHADRIAQLYGLTTRTWFQRQISGMDWDDKAKQWNTHYVSTNPNHPNAGDRQTMRSRFVVLTTGFTLIPRAPQIPGIEKFKGSMFHTARWDYFATGGSPNDNNLSKLADKRVAIIGTGATAIQVVSPLGKSSKHLYVFQRTPSAVDRRDNAPTDPKWWKREHSQPGWQRARRNNFNAFLHNAAPSDAVNLVNDGWTRMRSYSVLSGNPDAVKVVGQDPAKVAEYAKYVHSLDLVRQDQIRKRVEDVVEDPATAERLKPWYPGWCKRPCFGDDYLDTFNRSNVTLVDTDGEGVTSITESGLVANGKEYPVDVLVLSTGYRSPFTYSPGKRVNIDIFGRNGVNLDDKWQNGVTTLHGFMSHDFPNLTWPSFAQAGAVPNFTHCIEHSAEHIAAVLAQVVRRVPPLPQADAAGYKYNFVIEPTAEAEEAWSQAIAAKAGVFAASAGCTPSYINAEGDLDKPVSTEEQQKRARGALWGNGFPDFIEVLAKWRTEENLAGLQIEAIA